jgi:HEPN domain-containing protein
MSSAHLFKRIGKKNWDNILELWVHFLPEIEFPIIAEPINSASLEKLKTIKTDLNQINTSEKEHFYIINGIHNLIFQEAVYLFYKALNVLRATQCELEDGFKTWSIANAYQSSFFSIKSLLNILGVHISRIDSKDLLIDIFPDYKKLSRKEIERRKSAFECQVQLTKQMEHWELWALLQRVLNIFKCPIINDQIVSFIYNVEPKDFARQRNKVIYYNTSWLFNDLKECIVDPNFCIRKIDYRESHTYDDDFSLIISFVLLKICYDLFKNISTISRRLQLEIEIIDQIILKDNHNRYNEFWDAQEI